MKILDNGIKEVLEKIKPLLENAQTMLDENHDWKVKGKSFSIDTKGVVTEKGEE